MKKHIHQTTKKTYSRPRWPYDEPLTPGLRRKPKVKVEAIGFMSDIISRDPEDDYDYDTDETQRRR